MTLQGFGQFPFGEGPFGYGVNYSVPLTSTVQGSFIEHFDIGTNDLVLKDGVTESTSSVRQKVEMIIGLTASGSVSIPGLGIAVEHLGKIDAAFTQRVNQSVRTAFADLITSKQLQLTNVNVSAVGGRVLLEIEFVDLTTGKNQSEFVRAFI